MLHSLLLSSDRDTARVVTRVFKDLEVDIDHCEETFSALSQAIEHHYDAIIIDDSMEEPHVALQKLIALPSCSTSVRIVLADPSTGFIRCSARALKLFSISRFRRIGCGMACARCET